MANRYTVAAPDNRAYAGVWGKLVSGITEAERITAENTTAAQAGASKWIWPVSIAAAVVVVALAFILTRKKGR